MKTTFNFAETAVAAENKIEFSPFYMKVSSPMSEWVINNEALIKKAIRKGMFIMNIHRNSLVEDIYSAFMTHFVEKPHREEIAVQMENLEGWMFQEATHFTMTSCQKLFSLKEYSILDDSEMENFSKGVTKESLKSDVLSPEEQVIEFSDCDMIFQKLEQYDTYFYQAGLSKRFSTTNWVIACFLEGEDPAQMAYMLGISKSTLDSWNRKITTIVAADRERFGELYEDIKQLRRGANLGWAVPVEYVDEDSAEAAR